MPKSRRINCLVLPHASYGPGTLRLNGKERNGSRPKWEGTNSPFSQGSFYLFKPPNANKSLPFPQVSLLVWSYKFWSMLSSPSNLAFSSRTQPDKHWSNRFTAYRNHLSLEASSIFKLWSLEVKTSKLRAIVTCWYLTTFLSVRV